MGSDFGASDRNDIADACIDRAHFLPEDFVAAILIVLRVTATAIPGVLPLLLLDDAHTALRIANMLQICLLFGVGYAWAHDSGASPLWTGVLIALLGTGLVLIAVALGG